MTINVFGGGDSSGPVFPLQRSVRLRSSASAYFNRTLTTPTSSTIWTWSAWVKRGALTGTYRLFGASTTTYLTFNSSDQLNLTLNGVSAATSTAVFRDPSAWYHIVYQQNGSAQTIYVNNASVATGTTAASIFNTAIAHQIGAANTTNYFDGYLTEVNFIDGQALTPASFGSINSTTGVWQPIKYSGTYGTNGFYLNFNDNSAATAAAIGKDNSGNGNNWTPNNISVTAGVTYDSMLDVPTLTSNTNANFATLNFLNKGSPTGGFSSTMSAGNLNWSLSGNSATAVGTIGIPTSGKWYWEAVVPTQTYNFCMVGVVRNPELLSSLAANVGYLSTGYAVYAHNGQKYNNGVNAVYMAAPAQNTIITIAFDADAGALYVGAGGSWANGSGSTNQTFSTATAAYTGLTANTAAYYPAIGFDTGNAFINFGQQPFTYTPPTGFKSLNTYNLPAPTIPNGATQFAATLWTGNGTTQNINNTVNGISFQPDFVWLKSRSSASWSHFLQDTVRGITNFLISNSTAAETTTSPNIVGAINASGFTVLANGNSNNNADTYVGWQWKAGGTAVTNTSGSISSQVSANPSAGFSIVTYTGTGANATVGHGLGIAPRMIIVKERNGTGSDAQWFVYHASLGNTSTLVLNGTSGTISAPDAWNNTSPSSTAFTVGTSTQVNQSSGTYVAYCFSEIAGYSKFGSYTGNNSATDGAFVYLGFRPRFLIIKSTSASTSWVMVDSSRNTYNLSDTSLYSESADSEATIGIVNDIDFLSNGFKLRNTTGFVNASQTYIYAAFAESPFNYSLAR